MAIKYGRPLEAKMRFVPVADEAPSVRAEQLDITHRPRRNRRAEWARRLVRENVLTADDLIWPLFLIDGERTRAPVASMPGIERLSIDEAVRAAHRAAALRIPCLALFPYTDLAKRDAEGTEALNPENSGLPDRPRHQTGGSRTRHYVRRRARPLHQPRP